MPEIFSVEAEGQGDSKDKRPLKKLGDSVRRELSKTKWCKSGCQKNSCNRQGCGERVRSSMKEIGSVERVIQKRATTGWERVRIQIDSGAIDTVGPKETAGAFKMRERRRCQREASVM